MTKYLIKNNGSYLRIETEDKEPINKRLINSIKNITSLPIEEDIYFQVKNGSIPIHSDGFNKGKYLLIKDKDDYENLIVPTGFINQIVKELDNRKYPYEIKTHLENLEVPSLNISDLEFTPDLRDYQEEVVKAFLTHRRGIIESPTGSGKTFIISELLRLLGNEVKSLILVPGISLLYQTIEAIEEFLKTYDKDNNWKVGCIGDGKWIEGDINVAIDKTLLSDNRKEESKKLLKSIQALFIDECGEVCCNNSGWDIITRCYNKSFSIALSATPWVNNGLTKLIKASTGDFNYKIDTKNLIKQGYLSDLTIELYETSSVNLPLRLANSRGFSHYKYNECYHRCIVINHARNRLIVDKVKEQLESDYKPLIIVIDRVGNNHKIPSKDHSHHLGEILKALGISFKVVSGATSSKKRKEIFNLMKNNELNVLIANSKIISSGIDIPNLKCVVMASAGKADHRIIQKVGRALRNGGNEKDSKIIDFMDKTSYFVNQSLSRKNVYEEQYGFDRVKEFDD